MTAIMTAISPDFQQLAKQNRTYWIYQLTGWGAVAAFFTGVFGLMMPAGYMTMGIIYSWGALTGLLLTHAWRIWLKRRQWFSRNSRPPWFSIAVIILLLGTIEALLVGLGFFVMRPVGMGANNWGWLPSAIGSWAIIFAVWTSLYSYTISARRTRQLEAEALRFEIYAKDAELRALQAQVNPHFFFNSLNSVRALIFENQNAAAQMIDQLAGIMRYTLQSNENATVTLAHEMEAVSAYLAIERIRFEERLIVTINIEAGLAEILIPPMAVQTLVENAVKYGVERNLGGSEIRISAKRSAGSVEIEVANQGAIAEAADTKKSTQLGLENARKRLAIMSDAKADLRLFDANGWVRAVITLPYCDNNALDNSAMNRDAMNGIKT